MCSHNHPNQHRKEVKSDNWEAQLNNYYQRPKYRFSSMGRLLCYLFVYNSIPHFPSDLLCMAGRWPLQAAFLGSKVNWLPARFGQWEELEGEPSVGGRKQAPLPCGFAMGLQQQLCLLCSFSSTPQAGHDSTFHEVVLAPGLWLAPPPPFVSGGG